MTEEYDLSKEMTVQFTDDGDTIEGELCYIDLFMEYPCDFLPKFATKIRTENVSRDDIVRMIELLDLDSYVLHRALATGIHPITGNSWYKTNEFDAVAQVERLVARNNRRVTVLKNILKKGYTAQIKQEP